MQVIEGRERDVGIICVIIYDDLALEAWTQIKGKRERERGGGEEKGKISTTISLILKTAAARAI